MGFRKSRHGQRQLKTSVNKRVEKVNTKIKILGLNIPGISSSGAAHHDRGGHIAKRPGSGGKRGKRHFLGSGGGRRSPRGGKAERRRRPRSLHRWEILLPLAGGRGMGGKKSVPKIWEETQELDFPAATCGKALISPPAKIHLYFSIKTSLSKGFSLPRRDHGAAPPKRSCNPKPCRSPGKL